MTSKISKLLSLVIVFSSGSVYADIVCRDKTDSRVSEQIYSMSIAEGRVEVNRTPVENLTYTKKIDENFVTHTFSYPENPEGFVQLEFKEATASASEEQKSQFRKWINYPNLGRVALVILECSQEY